eukprot:5352533-Amphidinium_carterae.1
MAPPIISITDGGDIDNRQYTLQALIPHPFEIRRELILAQDILSLWMQSGNEAHVRKPKTTEPSGNKKHTITIPPFLITGRSKIFLN